MSTSEFDGYKVDHLFLLIGENPLPNYVAAKMLLEEGGKPYLVFSERTEKPAERLKEELGLSDNEMVPLNNNEANSYEIKKRIREKIKEIQREIISKYPDKNQFGLNYTGGTKAMAAHAYQALLILDDNDSKIQLNPPPSFSYLDSSSLKMLVEQKGNPIPIDVNLKEKLSLKNVFDLHEPWSQKQPPIENPKLPELAKEIAVLHTDVNVARAWRWWCDYVLRRNARNSQKPSEWLKEDCLKNITIPLQANIADINLTEYLVTLMNSVNKDDSVSEIIQNILHIFKDNEFKKIREMSQLSNSLWSSSNTQYIEKIVALIQSSLGLSGAELSLADASQKGEFKKIKHLCKWLDGEWLEHHVLQEIKNISSPDNFISDSKMSFHIQDDKGNDKFEFDVAFIHNYQLFAISCTTDTEPGLCKLKLFEAYRRTRQMGGDEARVALVCCYEKPEKIKKGFMAQIQDENVNVFGCGELAKLSESLKIWIQKVDK
ncbi:hypothetical protein AMR41_23555 [Hapalosiphon sp. MRB220]|nr:hypothetical protein AMR41_23555 [Hapalosiphon sp. MRB220]